MISASDRMNAIQLIEEAVLNGARVENACNELGICSRTYRRWKTCIDTTGNTTDLRPVAERPVPVNKLTDEEIKTVHRILASLEFADKTPHFIVPCLADRGIYLASEATMYRLLRAKHMQTHRGVKREAHRRTLSTHLATQANEVWMWDITYLPGAIKGQYYYLYTIEDLFSRKIVGWEIYDEQTAEKAALLIRRTCLREHRNSMTPLVLHSDNGTPMKGATMLATLRELGITPSNSRPRVSNDNPYIESFFSTLKYAPEYPRKGFGSLENARRYVAQAIYYYNYEHLHSGIQFVTPSQRHEGADTEILAKRAAVYEAARKAHPERWNGRGTRNWKRQDVVSLNPEKADLLKKELEHFVD